MLLCFQDFRHARKPPASLSGAASKENLLGQSAGSLPSLTDTSGLSESASDKLGSSEHFTGCSNDDDADKRDDESRFNDDG